MKQSIGRAVRRTKNRLHRSLPRLYNGVKRLIKKGDKQKKKFESLLRARFNRINPKENQRNDFEQKLGERTKVYNDFIKAKQIAKLLDEVVIEPQGRGFFYNIDVYKYSVDANQLMVNSTLDYGQIIHKPLSSFLMDEKDDFTRENNIVIRGIIRYIQRCMEYVGNSDMENRENILSWLGNMENGNARTLPEAFQRILFINMLLWQTNHRLVGLGRLDLILDKLYENDPDMNREKATQVIMDFFATLHSYYWFKSDEMLGDTGQITILGGKTQDGEYFFNDLTYGFIDAIKRLQIPDPKVLLRVGQLTPERLILTALDCINTGIGSPLFSNDEQVIPAMIEYGYSAEDAHNYVTSACWEPLIPALAHEQNNIGLFNFLLPLELIDEKEGLEKFRSFNELFEAYCTHLKGHVAFIIGLMNDILWENDPLISAFTDTCRDRHTDVGNGGGKYNNYGILSVALSNAVNSLLILKKYVFEEKMFSMAELNTLRRNNFRAHEDVRQFLNLQKYYGTNDDEAIELTRKIMQVANEEVKKYKNPFGDGFKFGLSSPGYIKAAEHFPASFDGRKAGAPYAVHISGDDSGSFTQLMEFASKLDYSGSRFNGNVVDFFVSPNLLAENREKFASFIRASLDMGVFQTQMNVVSSQTLLAARTDPDQYPGLIVRVWGFSAYFVDLPDAYKDYLIERAIKCERAS